MNLIGSFFVLKKSVDYFFVLKFFENFGIFLLTTSVDQVWVSIAWYSCTFTHTMHDCACTIVLSELLAGVGLFPCVVTVFYLFVIAKWVFQFCACLHFCSLHRVDTSALYSCVLIYVLACLYFGFVYMFACLPYFLQWFCNLFNCFFLPNYSYLLI